MGGMEGGGGGGGGGGGVLGSVTGYIGLLPWLKIFKSSKETL